MCIWDTLQMSVHFHGASLHARSRHMLGACLTFLHKWESRPRGRRVWGSTFVSVSVGVLAPALRHSPIPLPCHLSA